MSSPFDILTDQDNQEFYKHLMSIWDVIPDKVKERFKREQQCLLCEECKNYVSSVQKAIRDAKRAKQQASDL